MDLGVEMMERKSMFAGENERSERRHVACIVGSQATRKRGHAALQMPPSLII